MKRSIPIIMLALIAIVSMLAQPEESFANAHPNIKLKDGNATGSSYSPTDVDPAIKNRWEKNNVSDIVVGGKYPREGRDGFNPNKGNRFGYDVYQGVTSNTNKQGLRIEKLNGKDHLAFDGWSVIDGYYHHDRHNQVTYIGAVNVKNPSERKIYKAKMTNMNAYNDLKWYFSSGENKCPNSGSGAFQKYSSQCNMEYKWVGFKAYLPLDELFPKNGRENEWRLFIIKGVKGHGTLPSGKHIGGARYVESPLVMPSHLEKRSWSGQSADVVVRSGTELRNLQMVTASVIRQTTPRSSIGGGHFTEHRRYRHVLQDENAGVTAWLGVRSPHDNNQTRYASSMYWDFGGNIATVSLERTHYDIGIKHVDQISKEVLLEEKPKSYKRGTRTFNSKSRGYFKTPEGYEYVPMNTSKSVKVDKDKTITFNYKASLPNPSRVVEQGGGKNTHGKSTGEAEWKLAKEDKPEELPDPNSDDFEWKNVTGGVEITKYIGNNKNVNIPTKLDGKNVVSIGNNAFANKGLTGVTLPDTVIRINEGAFKMNNLGTINIPDNVTTISDEAFANNRITGVSLPDNVKTVGTRAFFGNSISDLTLGETIESIGELAFANNQIPTFDASHSPKLKYIEDEAFLNNEISSALFNEGLIRIGEHAFTGNALSSVNLPSTVDEVKKHAFVSNLIESVVVHNNQTQFGTGVFASNQDDPSVLTVFGYVPSTAKVYAEENNHTFRDLYDEYVYIDVTGGVEIIKYNGDDYNLNIPSRLGGKNVVSIGSDAFKDMAITSIKLPSTVHTIGEYAFADNELTSVDLSNVKKIKTGAFTRNEIRNVTFNSQLEELGAFSFRSNKLTSVTIPSNITVIERYAFDENELTSVNLHNDITNIKERAFADNKLKQIVLPNKIRVIGELSFWNNDIESINTPSFLDQQKKLEFPQSLELVDNRAFDSNNLEGIVIKKEDLKFGSQVFTGNRTNAVDFLIYGYSGSTAHEYADHYGHGFADFDFRWRLINHDKEVEITGYNGTARDLTIPSKLAGRPVTSIGEFAFGNYYSSGGEGLTSVVIPDTVTTIGDDAFIFNALTSLTLGENVTSIGESAFFSNALVSVIIPDSVTTIGAQAFGSNEITSLVLGDNVTTIGAEAFKHNEITSLVLGENVTSIGESAFAYNKLESVFISEGITVLEKNLFQTNKLTEVVIPDSVKSIESSAFFANNITSVTIGENVEIIGTYAFGSNEIKKLVLPVNLKEIKTRAFYDNYELESVVSHNKDVKLGEEVFSRWLWLSDSPSDITIYGHNPSTARTYARSMGHSFRNINQWTGFNLDFNDDKNNIKHQGRTYANIEKADDDSSNRLHDGESEEINLSSSTPMKWLSNFFKATEVNAKTRLDESVTHLINNFVGTGNHRDIRNVKHTIKVGNHTGTDTKPFAIVLDPKQTKDKDMEYDYEYEYTNHIKRTYTCTDKKGSDCFAWRLSKNEPVWEAPYAKKFRLSDTKGEFERYTTSRVGRIDRASARIYSSLNDTTGTQAGNSRIRNTYYIKEKAVHGNEARYLISSSPSSSSGVIGWVNELDMTTYTNYTMDSRTKRFELTGVGKAYARVWGGSAQEVAILRNHRGKTFTVNLTETIGDNIWYRGTFNGVSGNVWVNQNHTTSNEIIKINETTETKLNNVNNNNAKYVLGMDHKHNDTVIVDKDSNAKIESLIGRERVHTERSVTEDSYGETIKVDRKDTKLKTQSSKEVENTFTYHSDYGNEFTVVDGDKYYYPYDLDESVRHKYENKTNYNYGKFAIPLRVSNEKKNEIEFKLTDNFFLTKKTGFMFSLPHDEVSTLVINQTAKEEFEAFTGNEYSDTVISDPFNASRYYLNIDLNAEQKPKTKYDDNVVIGKVGLSDITVHLLQELEFEHYLFGHYSDDPIIVDQRTSPVKNIDYPHKVKLTKDNIDTLRELKAERDGKIHSFKPTDYKEFIGNVKEVAPY